LIPTNNIIYTLEELNPHSGFNPSRELCFRNFGEAEMTVKINKTAHNVCGFKSSMVLQPINNVFENRRRRPSAAAQMVV
jgi:hypothetical protein